MYCLPLPGLPNFFLQFHSNAELVEVAGWGSRKHKHTQTHIYLPHKYISTKMHFSFNCKHKVFIYKQLRSRATVKQVISTVKWPGEVNSQQSLYNCALFVLCLIYTFLVRLRSILLSVGGEGVE